MLPFLLTFGLIGFMIVCGVRVSLYLYKQGVFGKRGYGITRRSQTLVERESAVQRYTNVVEANSVSSRYARQSLLVFLGGLTVVLMFMLMLVNIVLH